jgi:hypothetical protein
VGRDGEGEKGEEEKESDKKGQGDTLDLGAAQQLSARKGGAVVTGVGKVDRRWVLDGCQEGKWDDIDGCIWVCQ